MVLAKAAITAPGGLAGLGERISAEIRTHKTKYIFQAGTFIVSGILTAALPGATSLNTELLVGIALLVTGIFQAVLTLQSKTHMWSLLSALLSIIFGAVILWKPLVVLQMVVTAIALFMTIEGLLELFIAFEFRPARNWHWMLVSGMFTLLLAMVTWIGFPAFDILYLSWVIAANLIMYGVSLMMLVWRAAS